MDEETTSQGKPMGRPTRDRISSAYTEYRGPRASQLTPRGPPEDYGFGFGGPGAIGLRISRARAVMDFPNGLTRPQARVMDYQVVTK